jgi:hypothetical protein
VCHILPGREPPNEETSTFQARGQSSGYSSKIRRARSSSELKRRPPKVGRCASQFAMALDIIPALAHFEADRPKRRQKHTILTLPLSARLCKSKTQNISMRVMACAANRCSAVQLCWSILDTMNRLALFVCDSNMCPAAPEICYMLWSLHSCLTAVLSG